jgi:hypothetical protein
MDPRRDHYCIKLLKERELETVSTFALVAKKDPLNRSANEWKERF